MTDSHSEQDSPAMPAALAELLSEPGWERKQLYGLEDYFERSLTTATWGKADTVSVQYWGLELGWCAGLWPTNAGVCAQAVHEAHELISRIEAALAGDAARREAGEGAG